MSQIKANALTDVDVSFVSLVKRGANRIPFRIKKEDVSPMIDLDKLFIRKGDATAAAAKLAKAEAAKAALAKDGAGLTGTMPIPTNAAEALTAAQELLKANGFSVIVAQADAAVASPTAKAAVAADQAASEAAVQKAADDKFAEMLAAQKAKKDKAAAKKAEADAELAAADAELVALEKGAPQKQSPQAAAAKVNAGKPNPIVEGGMGFKDGEGDAEGAKHPTADAISKNPVHGNENSTAATQAIVSKLEETMSKAIADLAALVKASTEATAKRLDAVEVSTKKADATVSRVVLGGAHEDATEVVRKSASAVPPLLDTGMSSF